MKKKVLIGFLNRDVTGAIPTITEAFIKGLGDRYDFIPFHMDRKHHHRKTEFNLINIYYLIKHYISWIIEIIRNRPDIAHFPVTSYWNLEKSLLILFTARLMGVDKVIGHLHGGAFEEFWESAGKLRRKIALRLFNQLDAFIVLSSHWKKIAVDTIGVEESKVFIVNNPLDVEYAGSFDDFSRDYDRSPVQFISISGLTERKGILDSIESLSRIKTDYRYNIVGKEAESGFLDRLKAAIDKNNLKDKAIIHGGKYGQEKIGLMKRSDVYLLPSYVENFPLAIIEAACAGIPAITTPVGALPEFFEHMKNIYYVEPGNIEEIRGGIELMLNNPRERERLGRGAREVYREKLSAPEVMKQLDYVYEEISGQATDMRP